MSGAKGQLTLSNDNSRKNYWNGMGPSKEQHQVMHVYDTLR